MTTLIKKYKNRRLYDTQKSQYITLEDLQKYVLNNQLFTVEDSGSGKDLTNSTLLQIIADMENGSTQFLSSDMLRQFIRFANHPMNQSMQTMLEQFLKNLETPLPSNPYVAATEAWDQFLKQFKTPTK